MNVPRLVASGGPFVGIRPDRGASACGLAPPVLRFALALSPLVACSGTASRADSRPLAREAEISGSKVWSETCGCCHLLRSPSWYGDAQWEVAGHHMAIKAHLTPGEREAVVRYLKAANGP